MSWCLAFAGLISDINCTTYSDKLWLVSYHFCFSCSFCYVGHLLLNIKRPFLCIYVSYTYYSLAFLIIACWKPIFVPSNITLWISPCLINPYCSNWITCFVNPFNVKAVATLILSLGFLLNNFICFFTKTFYFHVFVINYQKHSIHLL